MSTPGNYHSQFFNEDSFKRKNWAFVFSAYVILLVVMVATHEPWMDEAQAWLLVKDASLTDIFVKYLRYEGSPGLWHLILVIPAKLGFPYFTINILAAGFSILAVWLFLRYSPFPVFIKTLFPFSYFILYQYSVVARSYCLIAPLLFLIAIKFKDRIRQPVIFVVLLSLLAYVSAHAALIAGAFFLLYLVDAAKSWKSLDKRSKINQIAAVSIFGLTGIFLVLILVPPPADHFLDSGNNWSLLNFLISCKWAIPGALMLDESNYLTDWLQVWFSIAVFFITIFWLRRKNLTLWYLLPMLLILGLFAVKYRSLWHDGITFFLWIFALWIGFERKDPEAAEPKPALERIVLISMTAILATQIFWSFYIVRNDFYFDYSASYDIAEYIKENDLEDRKIFISGWKSIAILPYFDKNIFYNLNEGSSERFWNWSDKNRTPLGAERAVLNSIEKEKPDLVILASDHLDKDKIRAPRGYRLEKVFPGYLYWKTGIHELNTYWLFRKSEPAIIDSLIASGNVERDDNLQAEADALLNLFENIPSVPVFLKDEPILKSGTNTETGIAYTQCYEQDFPVIFVKKGFYQKANRKQFINALKHELTHAWLCRRGEMSEGHSAKFRRKLSEVGGFGN